MVRDTHTEKVSGKKIKQKKPTTTKKQTRKQKKVNTFQVDECPSHSIGSDSIRFSKKTTAPPPPPPPLPPLC